MCAPVYTAADISPTRTSASAGCSSTYEDEVHGTVRAPGVVPKLSGTPGSDPPGRRAGRSAPTPTRCSASWASRRERARRGCARRASCEPADRREEETTWRTGSAWTWAGRSPTCSSSTTTDDRQWRVKTPSTPRRPVRGRARPACGASAPRPASRPGDAAQRRARHDGRHQRGARVQGRARRAHHDAGLRPDPAPRALADAGPAGRLDHHDQARPAGLAGRHARGGRAHGRARRDDRPGRPRRRSRAIVARPRRLRRRVAHGLAHQLLRRRPPRAGDRRHRRGAAPRLPGDALLRRAARVPRVRADADGVHELLRAPARSPPTSTACETRCATLGVRARAQHPALRRRPDDPARGGAQPGLRRALRAVAAASRARCTSPPAPATRTSSPSTWAARRPTSRCARAGEPTIGRETTIGQFRIKVPSRRRAHGRRGRRLDRPRARAHRRAARRPASRRAPSPGPAAYGRGGEAPTVTDANVVVGHLPPRLIGGEMALDVEAARAAVGSDRRRDGPVASTQAAEGILAIVNENMAGALRVDLRPARPRPARVRARRLRRRRPAARERGRRADGLLPGDRAAVAGPAVRARRPRGRLPQRVRAHAHPAHARGDRRRRSRRSSTSSRAARATWMDARGHRRRARSASTFVADMRYHGQGYEIPVPLDRRVAAATSATLDGALQRPARAALRLPHAGHRRRRSSTCARSAPASCPTPELPRGRAGRRGRERRGRRRRARSSSRASAARRRSTTAARCGPGNRLAGPAIVTEFDSTTVVLPGYAAEVDRYFEHPDHPGGRADERNRRRAADRRDPAIGDRPDHARHHRERAAPRALRDGRGAVPLGHEPGDPRAARRVPDAHRPAAGAWSSASSAPTSTR